MLKCWYTIKIDNIFITVNVDIKIDNKNVLISMVRTGN